MDANNAGERVAVEDGEARERVSAHLSSPDRVVFTEADNRDGWIALDADAAVAVER
ncbi:hypothetical protein [Halobellus rubicundus]|uniref:Uncharacterized protein n=1 Tax=Halobellus rubicundus TaxID=2996466 RepID=A0ABD5MB60_9EURY